MEQTQFTSAEENMKSSLAPKHQTSSVDVVEVKTNAQMKQFLRLPRSLYRNRTTPYVMPLELHMKMMMGNLKDPEKHFFLAFSGGKPVARLGVKVHDFEGKKRLHFGFFECDEKNPGAAKALVEKAHGLYPQLEMMGPFHFKQEDPYIGVLVEGFQYDPYFMMPFNPKSYDSMLKDAGLKSAMDLFTYDVHRDEGFPQLIKDNSAKACKELGLKFRALDPKNLNRDARIIAGIFNEALRENWGFEEFVDNQIKEMVMMFKFFIDPRVVQFAMVDGKEIACLIMIPNYNHLIKPSHGKLGPGLIWRYLRRHKTTTSLRGYALGVLKKYQGHGIASALCMAMYNICTTTALEYAECEVSWVLANNGPMNELAKAMGGKQNKVYRIYKRDPVVGRPI